MPLNFVFTLGVGLYQHERDMDECLPTIARSKTV